MSTRTFLVILAVIALLTAGMVAMHRPGAMRSLHATLHGRR